MKFARRDATVQESFSRIVVEQQHALEHRARLLWVAPKLSRIDSNDFGFICDGVINMRGYERNTSYNLSCLLQTYCRFITNEKLSVSGQVLAENFGVISCCSGWRKDVVNQCLEFVFDVHIRRLS